MTNRENGSIHLGLEILGHQILTLDGRMLGKVDDLDIDLNAEPPIVTAILMGPQAWGRRFPGLLGRFILSAHRRMHPDPDPQPIQIPASHITDLSSAVEVAHEPAEAERGMGLWVREQFIDHIPGSRHATK